MLTETTRTSKGEVTPERSQESQYHSAVPLAAALYNSSPPTLSNESDASQDDSTSSSGPAYHRPPAIMTTAIQHKVPPRDSVRSTILASEVGHQQLTKFRTTEVLHIPIEEIEMGKELGAGSFGVVYKGQWDHKIVAVKQVKANSIVGGDKAIAEFEAEVSQMASTAYHENLVQLYGVTTLENGDLAAVVEYCAQGSLVDALYGNKKKARDWSDVRVVFGGARCSVRCSAFAPAGRDSPRYCGPQRAADKARSEAKVADFGMSRLLSESMYDEQTTLNAVGPLKWMAPEQMERRAYSRASDVFAFGVLLYEIFQRQVPWQGVSNIITAK
jgi:hypothetical protein